MTLISTSLLDLERLVVVFVVDVPRGVLFGVRCFVDFVFVEFVLFTFAFGVVVVSFSRFFSRLFTVVVDRERAFRVVGEDFDKVFLGERVEDAFLGVVFVPLDDELSFAFLGDIDHDVVKLAILPLYSVT